MTPWGATSEADNQALFGRTILQILPALDRSAAAIDCVEIAASLAEAGARPLVAGAPGASVSELQARGGVFAPFVATTRNPLVSALNHRRLDALIAQEGVELIHVRASAALKAALAAARKARIPLVVDFDAERSDLAFEADSIVVYTPRALAETAKSRPEIAARLRHGIRGVDLRQFSPDLVDSGRVGRLRAQLGVKAHERLIVAIDLPRERQEFFFTAASQLKQKNFFANETQDARFVWLWRGPAGTAEKAAFAAETERRGLASQVLQAESDDRAAACIAAVLVVAAAGESAAVEAQALGAPVALLQQPIVAEPVEEISAPPEVDAHLRTGWLIPLGQPQALARAAEEATRLGATARGNLGARARARARNFSTERMCALALGVYARHFAGGGA